MPKSATHPCAPPLERGRGVGKGWHTPWEGGGGQGGEVRAGSPIPKSLIGRFPRELT
jgi:hypothetical protein